MFGCDTCPGPIVIIHDLVRLDWGNLEVPSVPKNLFFQVAVSPSGETGRGLNLGRSKPLGSCNVPEDLGESLSPPSCSMYSQVSWQVLRIASSHSLMQYIWTHTLHVHNQEHMPTSIGFAPLSIFKNLTYIFLLNLTKPFQDFSHNFFPPLRTS